MRAAHKDGVVQAGAPVTLLPVGRVTRELLRQTLAEDGGWMFPQQVRMALPGQLWAQVGLANLARMLRNMAEDGEIDRQYNIHGRPMYRVRRGV